MTTRRGWHQLSVLIHNIRSGKTFAPVPNLQIEPAVIYLKAYSLPPSINV